jgi:hypothetical protein
VAFSFGFLHGIGFAGALMEIGLPLGEVPLALFTFTLGVKAWPPMFDAAMPAPSRTAPVMTRGG